MKTSVAFFGILSMVFIATFTIEKPLEDQAGLAIPVKHSAEDTVWQLTISGIGSQCSASFTAQSENYVSAQSMKNCSSVYPDLENLAKIGMDANGDITLFDKDGVKLVEFMETESTHHESFWPAHPLMTLAKADAF